MWYKRKLQSPEGIKESLGLPALSLGVKDFWKNHTAGLYGCEVKINKKIYPGALYYGPRLNTGEMLFEIYFSHKPESPADHHIQFRLLQKIRNTLSPNSIEDIQIQLQKDLSHLLLD